MANEFRPSQIRLDTVILAANFINEKLYKGDVLQWQHTATGVVGDQCVLNSVDGTLIFNARANTTNYTTRMELNRDYLSGFFLSVLSANSVLTITRASGRVR